MWFRPYTRLVEVTRVTQHKWSPRPGLRDTSPTKTGPVLRLTQIGRIMERRHQGPGAVSKGVPRHRGGVGHSPSGRGPVVSRRHVRADGNLVDRHAGNPTISQARARSRPTANRGSEPASA